MNDDGDDDTMVAFGGYVVERPSKSHSWDACKSGPCGGRTGDWIMDVSEVLAFGTNSIINA